jgi:imidazolonepropionase-like amidohydrolase
VLRGQLNLRAALDCGITTVRDRGAADNIAIDLSRAIEEGLTVGPSACPQRQSPTG